MQTNEHKQFRELVSGVYAFWRVDVSDFALTIWWNALKPYDFKTISDAFNIYVTNPDSGQYIPKPADIVRILQGSSQDSAYFAWAKTEKAMRSVGAYSSVRFDDPIIHAVIERLGGWVKICQSNDKELSFLANDFRKAYTGLKSIKANTKVPEYFVGVSEMENGQRGFDREPVISISGENGQVKMFNPMLEKAKNKLLRATV